jgi:hypothetical protein
LVTRLKNQLRVTLKKTRQLPKKIIGNSSHNDPVDVEKLLENLLEQTGRRRDEYIRQINILKDKFIQDTETIRMGLEKLSSSRAHREEISNNKLHSLNRLSMKEMSIEDMDSDDIDNLRAYERHLADLEKEVIEILTGRFKK